MLMLSSAVRVYVALQPVDLRKGFDGLAAATRQIIEQDPLSGHAFVFFNRRRNRVKVLVWQRTGYLVLYKRLERGRFRVPRGGSDRERSVQLDGASLLMLLEGLDVHPMARRWVWQPQGQAEGLEGMCKSGIG